VKVALFRIWLRIKVNWLQAFEPTACSQKQATDHEQHPFPIYLNALY